jgi:hypothetical protein
MPSTSDTHPGSPDAIAQAASPDSDRTFPDLPTHDDWKAMAHAYMDICFRMHSKDKQRDELERAHKLRDDNADARLDRVERLLVLIQKQLLK